MDQYVFSMVPGFISTEVRRCFATHFQECKIRSKLEFVSMLSVSFFRFTSTPAIFKFHYLWVKCTQKHGVLPQSESSAITQSPSSSSIQMAALANNLSQ